MFGKVVDHSFQNLPFGNRSQVTADDAAAAELSRVEAEMDEGDGDGDGEEPPPEKPPDDEDDDEDELARDVVFNRNLKNKFSCAFFDFRKYFSLTCFKKLPFF